MAGSFSDFIENELLDHLLGAATYTAPATVHLALFTVAPTDAGGGTEVSGGSYARVAVTNNATNFPAAVGGAKSNGAQLDFAMASANWGTIVAYAMFDAASAGNMLGWADLNAPVIINTSDTFRFLVGGLQFIQT